MQRENQPLVANHFKNQPDQDEFAKFADKRPSGTRIDVPIGKNEMLSGAQPLLPGEFLTLFVAQNPAQPFKITRHHRQRHGAGKTAYAVISNPLQSTMLQMIDRERDTRAVLKVLGKHLGKYGLQLHETKTRFIDFRTPGGNGRKAAANFDFLGFTHVWGTSRRGYKVLRQITSKSHFARAVKSVHEWCKTNRHRPLNEQQAYLGRVIQGHCAYYGITGNSKRLAWFRNQVIRSWKMTLMRRSRINRLNWVPMNDVILRNYPLPYARVVRSIYTC